VVTGFVAKSPSHQNGPWNARYDNVVEWLRLEYAQPGESAPGLTSVRIADQLDTID